MTNEIQRWLERDPDPNTRREIEALVAAGDQQELARRFGGRLEFGTAGLRGILGAGPNRMNRLVIRESTAGLGQYLLTHTPSARAKGVVIAYDGRRLSREFASDAACVLAGLGFRVFLFDAPVPTPVGAFAVRDLSAAACVVVTASHNPPEYNGYKVYGDNGAQIIPPHDSGIAEKIAQATLEPIPWREPEQARQGGFLSTLGRSMVDKYLSGVRDLSVHPITGSRGNFALAYTPLHGVGASIAEAALRRAGFARVVTVATQREPDPEFPTVRFPNPEEPGAMDLVTTLAKGVGASIACANDPDADRLAVVARFPSGQYKRLTGDQVGALLGADLISSAPKNSVLISTVVSSRLLSHMAERAGFEYRDTLTGFKWIADAGFKAEAAGGHLLFGYEEALGYTIGGLVRDKDGISALVAFAELASLAADAGKTVVDRLEEIYRTCGFFLTGQKSIAFDPDRKGPPLGDKLRQRQPTHVAGRAVACTTDIALGRRTLKGGKSEPIDLPVSDVIIFDLVDKSRVIVRPSGTEPKLKCYYEIQTTMGTTESFETAEARATQILNDLVQSHQRDIEEILA